MNSARLFQETRTPPSNADLEYDIRDTFGNKILVYVKDS